jgi:transcriptional regulator with XRE-family HTH domain
MGVPEMWTASDVIGMIRFEIDLQGMTQAEYARHIGCSHSYLIQVLGGRKAPSGPILDALGLERVVVYRDKR